MTVASSHATMFSKLTLQSLKDDFDIRGYDISKLQKEMEQCNDSSDEVEDTIQAIWKELERLTIRIAALEGDTSVKPFLTLTDD